MFSNKDKLDKIDKSPTTLVNFYFIKTNRLTFETKLIR